MATYSETIELKDKISDQAKQAGLNVRQLSSQLSQLESKLKKPGSNELPGVPDQVARAGILADIEKTKAALASMKSQKSGLLDSKLGLEQQALNLKNLEKGAKSAVPGIAQLGNSSASAADEMGPLDGALDALGVELPGVGQAVKMVSAVVIGVAAAVAAATVAVAAFALQAVEAREKTLTLFDALGEGKITGKQVGAALDELSDKTGQTRAQLEPLAKAFLTMGITGEAQLKALTLAAASAGAIAEDGAQHFTTLYEKIIAAGDAGKKMPIKQLEKQLQGVGLNLNDLAAQMGITKEALEKGLTSGKIKADKLAQALQDAATKKGGGPLAEQGKTIGQIWSKFLEDITKMFEGLKPVIDPFLDQVKSLFSIFGQAKPSGQAMKSGIQGALELIFKTATKVVPYIKHFLLDVVIYSLKAYIAAKPLIQTLKDAFSSKGDADEYSTALREVGGALMTVLNAGIKLIVAIGNGIAAYERAKAALTSWSNSASDAASNFISGLVSGISNGYNSVVSAVKGLADKAKTAFKDALGIKSPSKEMAIAGGAMSEGAALGVKAKSPLLEKATDDVAGQALAAFAGPAQAPIPASAPAMQGAAGANGSQGQAGANAAASGGSRIDVGGVTINLPSGTTGGAAELTEQAIALVFERIALSQGL